MTLLHPDPSVAAVVHAADLPWDPSPAHGVHRRRIERTGGEVARLTSVVRYAPGSRFPAHRHGGGEEYLVLEGTFSDEHGDHPAGSFVRNGVGSEHRPFTHDGCVILVKLWWMHPGETASIVEDTSQGWVVEPWGARRPLHEGPHDRTELIELHGGATLHQPVHGGAEVFVVSGEATVAGHALRRWSWLRQPGDDLLTLQSTTGARLYVRSAHLARPPALP